LHNIIRLQSDSQSQLNKTITGAITSLVESQRQTDARIDRLVSVVEKLAERVGGA
jgi:hypothetical protein